MLTSVGKTTMLVFTTKSEIKLALFSVKYFPGSRTIQRISSTVPFY